ncbi:hypothetical protein [Vibrio phage vB_VmeM-Yong XC32]|nr:hypothetical protein [Vibrio phage vB_VmeM-Yong XC31]QAX96626.1 hypothetical protein [Vibrio phage vB_VmeM-Yong XC32]QAX96944.1 hypothetical protein [Vibrio phage vB_VmeM-Yong MS31]QAX97249.1 hypothetical protein [Vibrio phage vB_VmeM-Yong MS32]
MIKPGNVTETEWVMAHPEHYLTPEHQEWVCKQIEARYALQKHGRTFDDEPKKRLFRFGPTMSNVPEPTFFETPDSVELMDDIGWDCGSHPSLYFLAHGDASYFSTVAKRFVGWWFMEDKIEDLYGRGYVLHEVFVKDIDDCLPDAMGQVAVHEDNFITMRPLPLDTAMELAKEEAPYSVGRVRYSLEHTYAFDDTPKGFSLPIEINRWRVETYHIFGEYTTDEIREYFFDLYTPGNGA